MCYPCATQSPDMLPTPVFGTRLVLRENKKNDVGNCPICIVVTIKGKRITHSTGLRVKKEQWEAGRVVKHPNAVLYNAQIASKLAAIEAELLTSKPADITAARRAITTDDGLFAEYARQALKEMDVSKGTKARWKVALDHVDNYAPALRWSQVTPDWLRRFNKHLIAAKLAPDGLSTVPGMEQSSARIVLVCMRRIFNYAKEHGVTNLYPFAEFKMPAQGESKRPYLTLEEVDRIHALLDRDDFTLPMRSTVAHFLLECYSGLRHSDWGKWQTERLIDSESLYLNTTKTGEPIYLPLSSSPRLKKIVDYIRDNNLQPLTNQGANRILLEVARHAKISKGLTTHVARHTFAVQLLERGFSLETVAQAMGVSLRVVSVYAKITRRKVAIEFEKIGGL